MSTCLVRRLPNPSKLFPWGQDAYPIRVDSGLDSAIATGQDSAIATGEDSAIATGEYCLNAVGLVVGL